MAAAKEEEAQSIVDPVYKTKIVEFLGRTTPIVLQNENGPCPLLAICNVLLLRNVISLSVDEPEVNQQRLLSLVAERLIDSNSNVEGKDESYVSNQEQNIADAIDLLPRLATGIDVNMHFGKINDFEFTRECAIFDLLDIALYHGWIVDPQDAETSSAIGSKSYNTLADELVHKISEKEKSNRSNVDFDRRKDEEDDETIDFAAATTAALGVPCPSLSRGLSFDDNQKGKGDLEEDEEVSRILDLSKSEKLEPVSESSEIINPGFEKVENSNSESNIFAMHKNETETENNEVVTFPTLILEDSSTSLDMDQFVTEKSVIEKTGEEQPVERTGEESMEFSNGLGVVDDEPIYQGEEYILNHDNSSRALMCESPEPVYEGEVVLAEQLKDSPDDHQWELVRNFLESNASQLTIYGLFCLQEGLKERELCVFFRNNHFSTMFKYNGELYLLATDQGYILQPDLVWEKLNEVNGDTAFMTGNFTQFKAENRGNDSWNEQQAMTSTADYLAALGSTDPSVSVTNSDLQYAMKLQQQEFEQQEEEQRIRQQQQKNRQQQQQQNRHQPQPPQPYSQQPYPTPPPGSNRSRLVIGPQNTPRPVQNQTQRTGETKKCTIM